MSGLSLNDQLSKLGYTTRPASGLHNKQVVNEFGDVVFEGHAGGVWAWLNSGEPHVGDLWLLLDGRANTDPESATVLLAGHKGECEEARSSGSFGADCVVMKADDAEARR